MAHSIGMGGLEKNQNTVIYILVNLKSLQESGIIAKDVSKVKILGDGELKVALIVALPCSAGARAKIESAGGKVIS